MFIIFLDKKYLSYLSLKNFGVEQKMSPYIIEHIIFNHSQRDKINNKNNK